MFVSATRKIAESSRNINVTASTISDTMRNVLTYRSVSYMVPVVSTVLPGLIAGGLVGLGAVSGDRSSVMGAEAYWVWAGSMAVNTKVRDRVPAGTMHSFSKEVVPVERAVYSLTMPLK